MFLRFYNQKYLWGQIWFPASSLSRVHFSHNLHTCLVVIPAWMGNFSHSQASIKLPSGHLSGILDSELPIFGFLAGRPGASFSLTFQFPFPHSLSLFPGRRSCTPVKPPCFPGSVSQDPVGRVNSWGGGQLGKAWREQDPTVIREFLDHSDEF